MLGREFYRIILLVILVLMLEGGPISAYAQGVETVAVPKPLVRPDLTVRSVSGMRLQDRLYWRQAFAAAERGHWTTALTLAGQAHDQRPQAVLTWMRYAGGDPRDGFAAIAAFLAEEPPWPRRGSIAATAEHALLLADPLPSPQEMRGWFRLYPPRSLQAHLLYDAALAAAGETEIRQQAARAFWQNRNLSRAEERRLIEHHGNILRAGDHLARFETQISRQRFDAARRLIRILPTEERDFAHARLELAQGQPQRALAYLEQPDQLHQHPDVAQALIRHLRQNQQHTQAQEMLARLGSTLAEPLWRERHILIRNALDAGATQTAYDLAASHGLEAGGVAYAEAEWLAGWIALRHLGHPNRAAGHFEALHAQVGYALSLSRAAYWAGRAHQAAGRRKQAEDWYAQAAQFGASYYGQLATAALGENLSLAGAAPRALDPQEQRAFRQNPQIRRLTLLHEIGAQAPFARLLRPVREEVWQRQQQAETAEARASADTELRLLQDYVQSLGRGDEALAIARLRARYNENDWEALFPRRPMPQAALTLPETLRRQPADAVFAHAIIRQESGFDSHAVSPAGARGLMQLLPGTAQQVAGWLDLDLLPQDLTASPQVNVALGRYYLGWLLERYQGSDILAIAAYNAGHGRVDRWMAAYGDPRNPAIDSIDWIERLPFAETRNYIQRVLEARTIYTALMHPQTPLLLAQLPQPAPEIAAGDMESGQ